MCRVLNWLIDVIFVLHSAIECSVKTVFYSYLFLIVIDIYCFEKYIKAFNVVLFLLILKAH